MRLRITAFVAALVGFAFLASTSYAGDGDKQKKKEGEKVEMKDVPKAVTDAAKKKYPEATFSSAEKHSGKKGAMYALHGKDGKNTVTLMVSSTGEIVRSTEGAEKGKKKPK